MIEENEKATPVPTTIETIITEKAKYMKRNGGTQSEYFNREDTHCYSIPNSLSFLRLGRKAICLISQSR